ncbi:RING finger protein 215 [Acipenser ruthenus]|uniref:RING finger protein 215 n=1 Tax=Acipenser ruthenus TaxID=7906 RepID=A0A444V533_ACIRT|nr:RING finger protein 215 [Acipenser ruthenus]
MVEDEEQEQDSPVKREAAEPWIGLVPVEVEQAEAQRGSQETFAAAVVSKMKRALVLGASALLILALNQNTIREGATLTLWSSCGRSRSGLYGEWQGVICTGETNSQVQKYLQQLWNTILLVALILCTGVVVQARWQYRHYQSNEDMEKYLQQLWNTILLVALILCTGVVVQARWQYRHYQSNEDMEAITPQPAEFSSIQAANEVGIK